MDPRDRVRAREDEQIVVALDVMGVPGEALAAEARFLQPKLLDHRAHRAVEDQNAIGEEPFQLFPDVTLSHAVLIVSQIRLPLQYVARLQSRRVRPNGSPALLL